MRTPELAHPYSFSVPAMSQPVCHFVTADGTFYQVWLTALELAGGRGVSRTQRGLCFETVDGRWVGSVPISDAWSLDDRPGRVLTDLLERAARRG